MFDDGSLPDDASEARMQALLDYRGRLDDLRINQHTTFDKTLVALATAAIGLSVVLFQWIAERQAVLGVVWIASSWTFLLVSLLVNLTSYLTSTRDVASEIARIDREIASGELEPDPKNLFRSVTSALNVAALLLFITGTGAMLFFAYLNASGIEQ